MKSSAAPPVYRPQPVPKVLQRKLIPGQQLNRVPVAPQSVAPPRIVQRKQPVAAPPYRPHQKSTGPKPVPAGRPVIQRYTSITDGGFRGKMSQHGRYVTGKNLSEIYVMAGSTVERSYNTGRTRNILGTEYVIWQPAFGVIGDCVAAMEELLHGRKLKYGVPDVSEYRDLKKGKKRTFGESDAQNRKRGKITDLGDKADPAIGQGYVIARQGTDRHLSLPQFHGAAVVAQDGEDNITLEASAPLQGAIPDHRVDGVYDMYGTLKKRQTFKSRYKAMYGKDATVSVVRKASGKLSQKAFANPRSRKVVSY